MPTPKNLRTVLPLAALTVAAAIAFAACSGGAAASPQPSTPATPVPTVAPSPAPVDPSPAPADPTPAPSQGAAGQFEFDLDVADAHDVSVLVIDDSDRIVGAASGQAGDGMSVRWSDIEIKNLDADSLQITFVGYPQDEVIDLGFDVAAGDGFNLTIAQQLPLPNTDALGADRVVVLDFEGAVDANDVYATFTGK